MDTKIKIDNILSNNKIIDLENFLEKRSCINAANQWLSYIFYLFQALGVFLVSIGNSYKADHLIWLGVGLNSLASFIYIIINSNHKISSSLYNNIQKIKNGNYVDEEDLDAIDKNSNSSGNLTPKNLKHLSSYI